MIMSRFTFTKSVPILCHDNNAFVMHYCRHDHTYVEYLMTMAPNVEFSRKEAFWESESVDECACDVEGGNCEYVGEVGALQAVDEDIVSEGHHPRQPGQ